MSWFRFLYAIACAVASSGPLCGEIESVMVRWYTPLRCSPGCVANVEAQLKRMAGVAEVHTDGPAGSAMMRWKPRSSFRYLDVNFALRTVGITPMDVHIAVRGTVSQVGDRLFIDSLGDSTRFILISPLELLPSQTTAPGSIFAYRLQPDTQRQLMEAERSYRMVTVTGKLVMPMLSPPNYLIIQSLTGTQSAPMLPGFKAR